MLKLFWRKILLLQRWRTKNLVLLFAVIIGICLFITLCQLSELLFSKNPTKMTSPLKVPNPTNITNQEEKKIPWPRKVERVWKETEWQVAGVLKQALNAERPAVPVIVVEEHFEVLKYWFDAVETGLIPKAGNTLLHIDGHADTAPPPDLSIVPWFRLPHNHSEVANMMTNNDVFILSAAFTGLINRVIWVWPDWDKSDHPLANETLHEVHEVKAGWRKYRPPRGKPFHRLCVCTRPHPEPEELPEEWKCWDDVPAEGIKRKGDAYDIERQPCRAVLTGILENVHESRALELLEGGDWIKKGENVLLDIDEDYFGCESSVMPLYKSGLPQSKIDGLTSLVQSLLCVTDVANETVADRIFYTIVSIVHEYKSRLCSVKMSQDHLHCLSEFEADKALIQSIPHILTTLRKDGFESLLCETAASGMLFQVIMRALFNFEVRQLEALKYVGICLEAAPTKYEFAPDSVHVCHGSNVPGQSMVTFYTPSQEETEARLELLKRTLSVLPEQPLLVTVCRSVRDGYTPWKLFSYIEEMVFNILSSVFSGVNERMFHFDENLLGGKSGWLERLKSKMFV